VSDEKGAVQAVDRAGGASVWTQDRLSWRRLTAPLALGREVAVGDAEGYVHFLSRETGSFVGRTATDGGPIGSAPLRVDGGFVVQIYWPVRVQAPVSWKPTIVLVGRPNVGKSTRSTA
jgi:outer membrane protein assembly factor BamB